MAKVKIVSNLSNDVMTITGGWLKAHGTAVIEAWEAPILENLYGNKMFVSGTVEEEPKPTKKTKK